MKVNQTWNKQKPKCPDMVPYDQMLAAVNKAANNSAACFMQISEEMMLLMLHETFGFGRDRCMRALNDFRARMVEFEENITQEFSAETFQMKYKERTRHRAELAWTAKKHDAELQPLVDPALWKPFVERYKGFGGTGAWCKE